MDGQIFLGWLKINISAFIAAFIISLLLAFLFPDTMLWFVRGWGAYSRTAGPILLEQTSKGDLFVNILAKNSFNTILYFIASLFFLSPRLLRGRLLSCISSTWRGGSVVRAWRRLLHGHSQAMSPPRYLMSSVMLLPRLSGCGGWMWSRNCQRGLE